MANNPSVNSKISRKVDYLIDGPSLEIYAQDSRYKKDQVYEVPELYYRTGIPNHYNIPESSDDQFYEINDIYYVDRLDLIAHDYYNNSKLWWIIAMANDIENPFYVPFGTILRIPATSSLYGVGGVLV